MDKLSGLQVFKYLPAAKKLPEGNCKKCKFPTCMAYALKLANGQADVELCPYLPEELKSKLSQSLKKPQKEIYLGHKNKVLTGGENVLYRHDKTFVNKTIIAVTLDFDAQNWHEKLSRILDFAITRINNTYKIDLVYLKGEIPSEVLEKLDLAGIAWVTESDLSVLDMVEDEGVIKTVEKLTYIRKKAILEKDEKFSNPVAIYFKQTEDLLELNSKAAFYLCKYASVLIFENFDEALFSTLMILRQDIYTDPQKPLQVESKVYEFNNPDENSLIFLSTNFALTFFAVSSELEALKRSSYLIVTPSEGMSILTAWAAEKITAQMIAKTVENSNLEQKVKTKRIIIPGLLSHMKDEIQEALPQFEIVVGTIEAYKIYDFVKTLD
jgi:acetyl-CoA decarbonylase/synthase complex subunit gamma